jgi:maltooligosyltrehalose trehalohydrolase
VTTGESARRVCQLGASVGPEGTQFRLYTSQAQRCEVRLYASNGEAIGEHSMAGQSGYFQVALPGVGHGALYNFVLDGETFPDPYARFLPQGVSGPAMVVESRYDWKHSSGVSRPLSEHVIYELHVGTFTEPGTYDGVTARLRELAALGITAIEIMPVAAFAGSRGWGYDGVALYAPFAPYGTPDELRSLIDEAHGLGLSVFLDVVYNHFGPAGNYLRSYSPLYFSSELRNAWGEAPNYAHPLMRSLVLDNALYWLRDFRFDGLRLDAIHAIVDPSPTHILRELAESVAALSPPRLLIAEDERNDAGCITALRLHGVWADDFHHGVRVTLTGERDGYYGSYEPGVEGIARTIEQGWLYEGQPYPLTGKPRGKPATGLDADSFVYCLQNHDQVGNRALGDRLIASISMEQYRVVSTLLLFLPMTPLLFMGQEWAATSPFLFFTDHEPELGKALAQGRREEFKNFKAFADPATRAAIPDPQDVETFRRSRLRWDERQREPHASVVALYRALLALRRSDPVMKVAARRGLTARTSGDVLIVSRTVGSESRVLLANFGETAVRADGLGLGPGAKGVLVRSDGVETQEVPEEVPGTCAIILGTIT